MVQSRPISFFRYLLLASIMRLHTHTLLPVRSFAFGLISLMSISSNMMGNFSAPANAQSFPNDSVPVTPANSAAMQYLVYLPNAANIKQAKILASDAFVSRLDTGEQVVQLGRFNNLNLAQRRAAQFSQAGLAPQIKTVQGKFAAMPTAPVSAIPSIPVSTPFPSSSAPIPVESIPIPTSRTNELLPGVPSPGFPNPQSSPQSSQSNAIEIVRSPQSISQSISQSSPQPIPQQSQPIPQIANSGMTNNAQLRYFVIIPTGSVSELQRVQAIAPTAQLRSSYRGTYIEVQGYPDRASAETLSGTIRRQGFDTRVVFL